MGGICRSIYVIQLLLHLLLHFLSYNAKVLVCIFKSTISLKTRLSSLVLKNGYNQPWRQFQRIWGNATLTLGGWAPLLLSTI